MKLILFDIDGTLCLTDGAGRRAIHRALIEVYGTTGPADHRFDGKTDPQIVRELMRLAGHDDARIDQSMADLLERYVTYLEAELTASRLTARRMPGVLELLDALRPRGDAVLGLLTGNLAAGATAKLRAVDIDPAQFQVGAYGSDHEYRHELPAIARQRLAALRGIEVNGRDIVIIGDTPADIECGRALGVRAIGVATGSYRVDELAAYQPSAVFETLAGTTAVIDAIFG